MDVAFIKHVEQVTGIKLPGELIPECTTLYQYKTYPKKAMLAEEGVVCRHVYYLVKGSCYSYYLDDKADVHAIQFGIEDHWVTDQYSFFSGRKGVYFVETLEPVEAWVISRENFDKLCNLHPIFDRFFRILIQNAFASLQYRLAKTIGGSAEERYVEFAALYPHFVHRMPQYLIASYLGIKPQSLSRIRKEISQRGV